MFCCKVPGVEAIFNVYLVYQCVSQTVLGGCRALLVMSDKQKHVTNLLSK